MNAITKVGIVAGGAVIAGVGTRAVTAQVVNPGESEPGFRGAMMVFAGVFGGLAAAASPLIGAAMVNSPKPPGWSIIAGAGIIGAAASVGWVHGATASPEASA